MHLQGGSPLRRVWLVAVHITCPAFYGSDAYLPKIYRATKLLYGDRQHCASGPQGKDCSRLSTALSSPSCNTVIFASS